MKQPIKYLITLLLLLFSVLAFATDIRGRIDTRNPYSGYFQPAPGAAVALAYPNGMIAVTASTGFDGFYYFYGVPPGQYILMVNGIAWGPVFIPNARGFDIPPVLI